MNGVPDHPRGVVPTHWIAGRGDGYAPAPDTHRRCFRTLPGGRSADLWRKKNFAAYPDLGNGRIRLPDRGGPGHGASFDSVA